jgi:hypothetical protein
VTRRLLVVIALSVTAPGAATSAASGEVVPGRPDESIQQAYPIASATTYSGVFDDTNYTDVDYLALDVPAEPAQCSSVEVTPWMVPIP